MKSIWLASAAVIIAVGTAERASAQASPSGNGQSTETNAQDVQASAEGDIIVTAQRRSESTTRVPISMTVRDPEQLAQLGISSIRDLHVGTPGLRIDRNGISVQPSIRGITALDGNPGNDANVAIYVDGVYRPNPAANNLDFPDVSQLEVLKGPQGTLFGRNATGGAIRITTMQPSFETKGQFTLGYGSFNDVVAKGYVTGPIAGDTVAAGIAGYYERNDGYLNDLTDGGKSTGRLRSFLVRGKVLIKPTQNFSVLLTAHYSNRLDGTLAGQPFDGNTSARGKPGVIIPTSPWDIANNNDPRVQAKEHSLSANATLDLGFASLNSVTAYNDVDIYSPVESDYTNIDQQVFFNSTKQKTLSQEFTLASKGKGNVQWLAGLFYYNDDAFYHPLQVVTGGVPFNIFGRQTTKAYAAFGEVNVELLPRFTLIGGLRYSNEKRALFGAFGVEAFPELAAKTFDSVTPRFSARYELKDGANLYATFSKGFKSGGFSASSLSRTPFNPEKVTAYEVGFKTPSRGTFRGTAAAFYYDYSNQQVQAATTLANGTTVGSTTNAASSKIYGAEFEGTARLTGAFSITASASFLHARYSSFPNAFAQVPILVAGVACRCGNIGATLNATGNQLVRAPDFTGTVTANYSRPLASGTVHASVTVYHSDHFFFTPDNRVGQPAYNTLGARLAFNTGGERWQFALWGKNLTDEVVYQGASILPLADGVMFAPPRSVGIEVTRRL